MSRKDTTSFEKLRQRALEMLDERERTTMDDFNGDMRRLLSELDTYRIELELQNEELRLAQLEQERSQQKYNQLFERGTVAYLSLDDHGRIVWTNPYTASMLGCPRADLLGKPFSRFIHFDDQDTFHLHRRQLKRPGVLATCTLRLLPNDGPPIHVQLDSSVNEGAGENAGGILTTVTDVSQLEEAREELLTLNRELERRVEERTHELQKVLGQLLHSEKLAAIGGLSASIAHELNNPLQGVLNIIKGVGRRGRFDAEDRELMDIAATECRRMRNLLRALQDFNRPTSGIRAPMDLHAVLDSVLLLFGKKFKNSGIVVYRHYADDLPVAYGVGDQIKQVIMNILANSIDACPSGGHITVATHAEKRQVVIDIADTGSGIAPEHRERIFEPFFSTKPEVRGTGLGLSVSYGIIKDHKGTIEVDSRPGEGCRFRILLPLRGPGRKAAPPSG